MDLQPSVTNTPGILLVAASKDDFQASLGCGACVKILGSGKPAAADLDGSPPVQGSLKGIIVDQDDSLNQGTDCGQVAVRFKNKSFSSAKEIIRKTANSLSVRTRETKP